MLCKQKRCTIQKKVSLSERKNGLIHNAMQQIIISLLSGGKMVYYVGAILDKTMFLSKM